MAHYPLERANPAKLKLAFAPKPEGARAVSMAVRTFLAENGVDERELFSFELCVAEASINAIEYAQGPARGLRPTVEVLLTRNKLEIRIFDYTPGFELPAHIAPPSPFDERGRGLFLIQSVMDEVFYVRGRHENVLIMRKTWGEPQKGEAKRKKANPLVGDPDEKYPLDDRDPLRDQPDTPIGAQESGQDLVRLFCSEPMAQSRN